MAEVKLGKGVPFYYFSRGTLDFFRLSAPLLTTRRVPAAFTATKTQFANQILGGFSHVFRQYIPGSRWVGRLALRDIGQYFATGTQSLAAHCFGPAPKELADPAEETAEKIADPVSSLKVERGGVDGTDPRSS